MSGADRGEEELYNNTTPQPRKPSSMRGQWSQRDVYLLFPSLSFVYFRLYSCIFSLIFALLFDILLTKPSFYAIFISTKNRRELDENGLDGDLGGRSYGVE